MIAPPTQEAPTPIRAVAAQLYPNKAHQRAFISGAEKALAGSLKFVPYAAGDRAQLVFRNAWLKGYDLGIERAEPAVVVVLALRNLLDVVKRSDPDFVDRHRLPQATNDEWNAAIETADRALARTGGDA